MHGRPQSKFGGHENVFFLTKLIFLISQPVFLKFHIKSDQGIVKSCNHESSVNGELVKFSLKCSLCLDKINAISKRLESSFTSLPTPSQILNSEEYTAPSISVIDPDNSNICMCVHSTSDSDGKMCIICRNIIEQQPQERCTLISEKTMFGDVIVNRIDSQHHLTSTYASNLLQIKKLRDPYTPESIESHSPQPEMDEKYFPINESQSEISEAQIENHANEVVKSFINEVEETHNNHHSSVHSVTPSQLTTRLEILRRESQFMINNDGGIKCVVNGSAVSDDDIDDDKSLNKSKKCLRCSCSIA